MTTNDTYGAVIKWAGGKSKLAPVIEEQILQNLTMESIDTYVEPFLGGGSFFFYMTQKYNFKNIIISDINAELINLYKVIQQQPKSLIDGAQKIQDTYNDLNNLEQKADFFYDIRTKYNNSIISDKQLQLDITKAVYFLFLNKVGFNGLYRVNSQGLYNVPFGKREKAVLFKESNILGVSELLKDVQILNCDYDETIEFASKNSLFYFDPPYRPLSDSSSLLVMLNQILMTIVK